MPRNELERLAALRAYAILDTGPEPSFDKIVRLATRLFQVPVVLLSFIDQDRQWFKACYGVDFRETPREVAFCAHTILSNEVLVVPDMRVDSRFREHPLVVGEPHVRFYAGAPIIMPGNLNIGTVCLVDFQPRDLTAAERDSLADLASLVTDELLLRQSERNYRSLIENTSDLVAVIDAQGVIRYQGGSILPKTGYTPAEMVGHSYLENIHPEDRAAVSAAFQRSLREKFTQPVEFRFRHRDGSWRYLEAVGHNRLHDPNLAGIVVNSRDISERKAMGEALRESEERFKSAFSQSAVGMALIGLDGQWLRANAALCAILGYTEDELRLTNFQQLTHPEDLEEDLQLLGRTLAGEINDYEREKRYFHKDGHIVWALLTVSLVRSEQDEARYFVVQVQDISERKRSEEQLRLLQSAIENAYDGVIIHDAQREPGALPPIIYVNEAFTRTTGYTLEEIRGKTLAFLRGPETDPVAIEHVRQAVEDGSRFSVEILDYHKNGQTFWIEYNSAPVEDFRGRHSHWVTVLRDITERRVSETALRESEARKAAVVETALDCIITIDAEDNVLEWNPAAEKTFGFSEAEVLGCKLSELIIPPVWRERHRTGLKRAVATGEGTILGQRLELPAWRKDGTEISIEVAVNRIALSGPPVFTAYLRDITLRQRNEAALLQAMEESKVQTAIAKREKERAEEASNTKSEFLSRMSHELRTPLNAILGFAQLLQYTDESDQDNLQQILSAGRHLLQLINEILEMARIEAGHLTLYPEPVPVCSLCLEALDLVRPLGAAKSIVFDSESLRGNELWAMADRSRLKQVLLNLLTNAIKYNHDGGHIAVSVHPGQDWLRIDVADRGWGISEDKINRLFTPFDRLDVDKSEVEGTGIGLALSRHLVEAMNGSISVQSAVGEGSTFAVEIPCIDPPHESEDDAAASGLFLPGTYERAVRGKAIGAFEPLSSRPGTPSFINAYPELHSEENIAPAETRWLVLYIEDNRPNVLLVQNLLSDRPDIRLLTAVQGEVGIELAVQHRPHVVLLDLDLPDIKGGEVLRRLRAEEATASIPIIVVSADATPAQIQRLTDAGADYYLTKPLDLNVFLSVMDRYLSDRN